MKLKAGPRCKMPRIDYCSAEYFLSANDPGQWPADEGAEVAFIGRSNVGKSSAINAICGRKALARTSKTPGRTREIIFFQLVDDKRLVDLPGYGYAKVSKGMRRHWEILLTDYLQNRRSLKALIILMDIRRPLTDQDQIMLDYCEGLQLPSHVLLTKADKFKYGKASSIMLTVQKQLQQMSSFTVQLFSAHKKTGVDDARSALDHFLQNEN